MLADHNPVMWVGKEFKSKYQWKLNEQLLGRKKNLQKLKDETNKQTKNNLGNEVPSLCVWDTYKVVIQGILIKMNYEYRRNKEKEIQEMQGKIREKESELRKNCNLNIIEIEILMLQCQLQMILWEEIQLDVNFKKQKYFEGADKARRMLASLVKKRRSKNLVTGLKVDGRKIEDHKGNQRSFCKLF